MDDIFSKYTERYSAKSFNRIEFTDQKKQKSSDEDILYTSMDEYSTKVYDTSYRINGEVGYMCPNCNTIHHIKTQVVNNATIVFDHVTDDDIKEIESSHIKVSVNYDFTMKCPICKYIKPHIRLDNNIADAIGILNIKGYITSKSSEGYKSIDGIVDPYIGFDDLNQHYTINSRTKIENLIECTLPISWYVDRPRYITSYTYRDPKTILGVKKKNFIPPYVFNYFEIKADFYNKEEALRDILKWARSLPDLKEGNIL